MTANQISAAGSCQCGAVTFEAKGEAAMVVQCHCLNCQKSSGTGHVPFAAFPEPNVAIRGKTQSYSYIADSGGKVTSHFCPVCGSPAFGTTTSVPGVVAIRLGIMDNSSAFRPQMEVFMKRMRSWDHTLKDVPSFEAMPPMPR